MVQPKKRDYGIDVLRGLAIFCMVGANMAQALNQPHPFLFRLEGSLAAPLFISLSAMMVSSSRKSWSEILKRALYLLVFASGIDLLVWWELPFISFDVLYVIALVGPLAFGSRTLPTPGLVGIIVSLPFLSHSLRTSFGYNPSVFEASLSPSAAWRWPDLSFFSMRQFFIDGWFPVFPWILFGFVGILLSRMSRKTLLLSGGASAVLSGVHWFTWNPENFVRGPFSELFYPPHLPYLLFAISGVSLLYLGSRYLNPKFILWPLETIGRVSLANYILHLVLISYLGSFFKPMDFLPYLFLWLSHVTLLVLVSFLILKFKGRIRTQNMGLRMLLGG